MYLPRTDDKKKAFNLYHEMVRAGLQKLASHIEESYCPPDWGFCVLMFEFGGDGKNMQWISNANREDMMKALREQADRLEKRIAGGPGDDPASVV
ncbi:hypothetical protein LCGC14_0163240 [marine sediment metagenome]|uniref:Uncharacterized protein n=1 Tax=marine sediment metagenome TaxID=412755 RepID=A0A0F9UUC1_9ZZZZ